MRPRSRRARAQASRNPACRDWSARWVQPESNHTSRMSVSLRNRPGLPHAEQVKPAGRNASTGRSYHASEPCSRVRSAARAMTCGSSSGPSQASRSTGAMPTPPAGWAREHPAAPGEPAHDVVVDLEHAAPHERLGARGEPARLVHRAQDAQALALADLEVFLAVAGRGVDQAGAVLEAHVRGAVHDPRVV